MRCKKYLSVQNEREIMVQGVLPGMGTYLQAVPPSSMKQSNHIIFIYSTWRSPHAIFNVDHSRDWCRSMDIGTSPYLGGYRNYSCWVSNPLPARGQRSTTNILTTSRRAMASVYIDP